MSLCVKRFLLPLTLLANSENYFAYQSWVLFLREKTAEVFLNSFDRSSFMRSLVAYFDNVDLSGKLIVFSPCFTFLSLVGHLNVFSCNILNFFSLRIFTGNRFQGCLFSSSLTMHPNKNIFRVLHHPAGESGETRGRGVGAEHHLRRHQLSPQAGVHHLLPQQ